MEQGRDETFPPAVINTTEAQTHDEALDLKAPFLGIQATASTGYNHGCFAC